MGDDRPENLRRPPLLIALSVLLILEAALMVGVVGWLLLQLATQPGASLPGAIAILVIATIGALWVIVAAVGSIRMRSWIRALALTWQLIQLAVAIGCFQGLTAEPAIGWVLLVPSVIGILLVLSPPVTRVLRPEDRR
jgi:hypothetical protein